MKKINCIMILAMLLSCTIKEREDNLPFYDSADLTPHWDNGDSTHHTISRFQLFNQDGLRVTDQTVKGKIYVANFFFTTCGSICPRMVANLRKVQERFANDPSVMILSHTVLPEVDSINQLKKYAGKKGINSHKWWLLTGDKQQLYTLARRSYFADEEAGYNRGSDEFLHTENCMLVDKKGRIRGVYNATLELEIDKLITHIEKLELSGN